MFTRARHARTLARTVAQPSPSSSVHSCALCTMAAVERDAKAAGKLKQVERPRAVAIDWSKPSTSAIPYSPSPSSPASTRPFSTSSRSFGAKKASRQIAKGKNVASASFTLKDAVSVDPLSVLEDALSPSLSAQKRSALLPTLINSFNAFFDSPTPSPPPLDRQTFDSLFARTEVQDLSFASAMLKRLRLVGLLPAYGYRLSTAQFAALLRVRLARLEQDRREREKLQGGHVAAIGAVKGKARALRDRRAFVDELAEDYAAALETMSRGGVLGRKRREEGAKLLEQYADSVARQLPRAMAGSGDVTPETLEIALRAATFLRRALELLPSAFPSSTPHDNPDASLLPPSEPSLALSLTLPFLLLPPSSPPSSSASPSFFSPSTSSPPADPSSLALDLLSLAASHGRIPSITSLRSLVSRWHGDAPFSSSSSLSSLAAYTPAAAAPDEYAHARSVLDDVCSDSGVRWGRRTEEPSREEKLDELLRLRVERVERAEALESDPGGTFARWLAFERVKGRKGGGEEGLGVGMGVEEKRKSVEPALRVWEAMMVRGRSEWEVNARKFARSGGAKLLEALVREACRLEREAFEAKQERESSTSFSFSSASRDSYNSASRRPPPPSPCLTTAIRLSLSYLPLPLLIHNSTPLLLATTVSSHSPHLAFALFGSLTLPPSSSSPAYDAAASSSSSPPPAPFTWSANLLPVLTTLFLSAPAVVAPSLRLRLYSSWTASGLSFPQGLWNALWEAAGQKGDVEEVKRLVVDWEETGRGPVSGRTIGRVLSASCNLPSFSSALWSPPLPSATKPSSSFALDSSTSRVLAPLRLLAFFRSRYAHSPTFPPPSSLPAHLRVPLQTGYVPLLLALARSQTDRRNAFTLVFRQLELDGHAPSVEAYNAAIAINVWRPEGAFTVKDLDKAGVVYNRLIAASQSSSSETGRPTPNRETFSLLLHGFLRVAGSNALSITPRRARITLEAARRTFEVAVGRGVAPRGQQVAKLVRLLARGPSEIEEGEEGDGEGAVEPRFEDAKRVQERWWALLARRAEREGEEAVWENEGVKREVAEMTRAREDVERAEVKWVEQRGEREEKVRAQREAWEEERGRREEEKERREEEERRVKKAMRAERRKAHKVERRRVKEDTRAIEF
ncbi:hypothetical protein JCM8547_006113 [Rhodosporidiobolus lusitaniae]